MTLNMDLLIKVDKLAQHYISSGGLDEQKGYDIERIEKFCATKDYAPKPYIIYYEKVIMLLDTRKDKSL